MAKEICNYDYCQNFTLFNLFSFNRLEHFDFLGDSVIKRLISEYSDGALMPLKL